MYIPNNLYQKISPIPYLILQLYFDQLTFSNNNTDVHKLNQHETMSTTFSPYSKHRIDRNLVSVVSSVSTWMTSIPCQFILHARISKHDRTINDTGAMSQSNRRRAIKTNLCSCRKRPFSSCSDRERNTYYE